MRRRGAVDSRAARQHRGRFGDGSICQENQDHTNRATRFLLVISRTREFSKISKATTTTAGTFAATVPDAPGRVKCITAPKRVECTKAFVKGSEAVRTCGSSRCERRKAIRTSVIAVLLGRGNGGSEGRKAVPFATTAAFAKRGGGESVEVRCKRRRGRRPIIASRWECA